MAKSKIKWCFNQKSCVEIIEPNENLSRGFLKKAEDALEEMRNAKKREWKIETGYYAIYHPIYSLLMKIGLKSELHVCTIEFIGELLPEYFSKDQIAMLNRALQTRKDATYYVNREIRDEAMKEIMDEAPRMIVKCKSIIPKLTEKKIIEIRNNVVSLKK